MASFQTPGGGIKARLAYFEGLTSLPVVYGIDALIRGANTQRLPIPDVVEGFQRQEFDVALLPTAEALQVPGVQVIPCASVSALGASRLFMIFSNKLPTEIQRVLVDVDELGATALAKLMFFKKLMIRPQFFRSEKPLDPATYRGFGADGYDAYLLTGRHGFFVRKEAFSFSWDLTLAWYEYSRLPFVINVWVTRRGMVLARLDKELGELARRNELAGNLADKSAEKLQMTQSSLRAVYQKAFYTGFDSTILTSLRRYAQEMAQNKVLPVQPVTVYTPPAAKRVPGV